MADENFEALMRSVAPEQTQGDNTEMVESKAGEEASTESNAQEQTEESTEMVEQSTEEQTEQSAENTEVEENTTTESETTEEKVTSQVNFNEWLKNETEGLFEDVETFKGSLNKFKDYDAKANLVAELEKNQLPDDAFVKKLAEMRSAGATKDQITEFIKINNEFDDFSAMTPKELQVAKLVLIDGYTKPVAERKVDREFNLSDFEEGTDEYQDMLEEQRIASKNDLTQLETFKAKISTVENKAEALKLENLAIKSAHEQNVKQTVPSLLGEFKGIGSLDLTGKVGKEDVVSNLSFEFDEEFSKKVPNILEFYFNQDIAPITPERVQEAKAYVEAAYLHQNWKTIGEKIYKTALAVASEKADNKFVNNTGVKETPVNPNVPKGKGATAQEWDDFAKRLWK